MFSPQFALLPFCLMATEIDSTMSIPAKSLHLHDARYERKAECYDHIQRDKGEFIDALNFEQKTCSNVHFIQCKKVKS